MERKGNRSTTDRREVHSAYMTVPTIVLNASPSEKAENCFLSHSRSAGDLDYIAAKNEPDLKMTGKKDGNSTFSSSMADDIHDLESRNKLGLYCSPRLPRRSVNADNNTGNRQSGSGLDSLNACSLNCLDPGSRVGSTLSLNSEYTTRSVGLISNDSSSECSQQYYSHGFMDGSLQKHSVLKRFYSSPEKDDDVMHHVTNVRRNSKSMGNMQGETDNCVCFEFGSDSTDDNFQTMETHPCDSASEKRTIPGDSEPPTEQNLVTMVTGGASLREGRIRKWLTEINGPDENANS